MKKDLIMWVILSVLAISISSLFYLGSQDLLDHFYPRENRAIFLDVGQGDSILLQTNNRENILIDGGPDDSVIYKLGRYIPFWDKEIDLLVLTHPDADHITGLVEVVRRYKVKKVLATGVMHTLPAYIDFFKEIKQRKIPVIQPKDIDELLYSNLKLKILWPKENLWGKNYKGELNDASIVVKATFSNGDSVLLTGDLTKDKEKELINSYRPELSSQILKAGHHGSRTSTSWGFLQVVKPEEAVISVGKNNRYGHPSFRVLKYLRDSGVRILRTDKLGDIKFVFN